MGPGFVGVGDSDLAADAAQVLMIACSEAAERNQPKAAGEHFALALLAGPRSLADALRRTGVRRELLESGLPKRSGDAQSGLVLIDESLRPLPRYARETAARDRRQLVDAVDFARALIRCEREGRTLALGRAGGDLEALDRILSRPQAHQTFPIDRVVRQAHDMAAADQRAPDEADVATALVDNPESVLALALASLGVDSAKLRDAINRARA